jgi:hypothetical protein
MANIVIFRPRSSALPDNANYTNRFEIKSESSDAKYIIAQHKTGRWWSCGCFGWIRHRHCKHLDTLRLPGNHIPCEARLADNDEAVA